MQKVFEHLLCVKYCSRCWDTAFQTEKVTLPPWVLHSTGEADKCCEKNEQDDVRKGSCDDEGWGGCVSYSGPRRLLEEVASEVGGGGASCEAPGREHLKHSS